MQKTKSDYLIIKGSQVWFLSLYDTLRHNLLTKIIAPNEMK
ncbi:MAG TPA: hypothetical protein PKH93_00965 [Chitinophagales bacterium]|nr:hypothetical protein [Chitinophagales bacterium]HNL06108.1 hypothetical protein [Chitinophagales bacterium]